MFDPNMLPQQQPALDPFALQEPEPDPKAPFGPEDPYKSYFGRKERFSADLGKEIFKKAESWKRMADSNGVMRQARENFRLYHNADPDGKTFGDRSFSVVENDGDEQVQLRINRFRNFLTHILNMTTAQKVAQQAKAANSESASTIAAQLYDGVLDYFLTQWKRARSSKQLHKATELCLFSPAGHLLMEWDAAAGEAYTADNAGQIVRKGDLYVKARSFLDVYFDTNCEDDDELEWVIVRDYMNKYELAERFPDKRTEILALKTKTEGESTSWAWDPETDLVPVYKVFWRSSMVLPKGRLIYALDENLILKDDDNPYRDDNDQAVIPLLTVRAADGIGTLFGYAPGNDIAPIQEAMTMVMNGIVTNEAVFGVGNVAVERGSDLSVQSVAGGLNVLEYAEGKKPPEPFSVSSNEKQSLAVYDMLSKEGGTVTGVNSVVQGNPEDALKAASGRALGLIQAMAVQFQSALQASYQQLVNDFGNMLLLIVKRFAATEQVSAIVGKDRVVRMAKWTGATFAPVARVVAETVNPLSKTIAGTRERAEFLVAQGLVTDIGDFHTVESTGQIEPLIEDIQTRNSLVAQENEDLLGGKEVPFLVTDDHPYHIKKHKMLLDSPQVRRNGVAVPAILAHLQLHMNAAAAQAAQTQMPAPGHGTPTQPPQQGGQSQTQKPKQEQQAPGPGGQPVPVPQEAQIQPAM